MPTIQMQLFNHFQLSCHGTLVSTVYQPRLQALLVYLVLHRDVPQSRRQLAFLFWPDTSEAQAHTNLRQLLHHLRRAWPGVDEFLQVDAKTLQWKPGVAFDLDLVAFEQAVARAAAAMHGAHFAAARTALAAAVDLYGGELLPNCYEDWLLTERERLHQHFLDALAQLMMLCESQRDYPLAIQYAQRFLRADPLHETTYRRLMRLHALNDDRASALRTYHNCADMLERELGVPPNQETQAAYARLLKLEIPVAADPGPPVRSAPAERLVGRQSAWQTLQAAWQATLRGHAHFVCIRGEAGIGKTRLAEELLNWTRQQGISQARARAYAAEGSLAYAPVTEWLRVAVFQQARRQLPTVWLSELARLLPEILVERPDLPPPDPLTERWQRQRFFEALARAILAGGQPLLLVIDDLQWCDQETLAWLAYLLRFDVKTRLLIIGTVRPEELDNDHPLLALLLNLRTFEQLTELELTRLDEMDTAALACQVADHALDPERLTEIYQASEGNPLFVVEIIRAGIQEQNVATGAQSTTRTLQFLPPKVQAVIQARFAQLSPPARALTKLAAVIGRQFSVDILFQASSSDEDNLARALDELWQRRIVREQGDNIYDFSHDRIRDVAYSEISPAQRRLLHKRVAQALVALHANNIDAISGQLGLHYEQARQLEEAVKFYRRAAAGAAALYAFDSVLFYLDRVVTLLEKLPATADSIHQQIECWLESADVLIITKGWTATERKQALERAYDLVKKVNDESYRFDVLQGLRGYYGNIGDWHTSYRLAEEALVLAEKLEDSLRLHKAYHSIGNAHLHRGEFLVSLHCYSRAMQIGAEMVSTARYEGTTNINVAETLWFCGYPTQAQRVATETLRMADEQGHPFARIHTREFMWYTYQRIGDEPTKRRLATELGELCDRFGSPDYAYPAKFFAGLAMVQDGTVALGLRQMVQALESLQQIGNRFNAPYFWGLLAQAQMQSGAITTALHTLQTAQQIAEDSGDQLWKAELVRLRGDCHLRLHCPIMQVEAYYQQALEIARQQHTKSLELRAALSLARLWQQQAKSNEARRLLAEIYSWFTEGFETADLQAAKALLAELKQ